MCDTPSRPTLLVLSGLAVFQAAFGSEVPRRAEEFVDSIGINAHIDVSSTVYKEAPIGQSGIRHLRSSLKPGATTLQSRLASLYSNYGIRVNLACDSTSVTPLQIRDLAKQAMVLTVEGLNEPDSAGPRSYGGYTDNVAGGSYPATMLYQRELFDAMLNDPATALKSVLSPAMGNPANSGFLAGIAADYVSMHSYPAQEMPTGNQLASFAIPNARMMAGDMPLRLIATETGYRSGTAWNDLSATATRKYVPRLYAEYFRLGMVRTFLFEAIDTGKYNYGLMDAQFTPKPAYYAVKNMIAILGESSWNPATRKWTTPSAFSPAMLDFDLSTPSTCVHHVLLQKSSGKILLLLWQEVPSYDLNLRTDVANPTVPVDLSFNVGIASASVYGLDSTTAKATYANVATLRVNVPDEVVIVELTPGAPPAPTNPGPSASIVTTVANATAAGGAAQIAVSRTGATDSPMTVYYSASGTAVAGLDYDVLPGYVIIPSGSTTATISVAARNPACVGRKNLVLALKSDAAYAISTARSAALYFGSTYNLVSDFNAGLSQWQGSNLGRITWSTTQADTGAGAMQFTANINGTDRWLYSCRMNFPSAQDWSGASKLVIRFKESASNAPTDLGKPVYFTWFNNGVAVGGGFAAAKFPLTLDPNYRTVTLDFGNFPRDHVTGLFFYYDGATLAPGAHTVFFDNVMAISDTNGVLADFEEYGASNWVHGSLSQTTVETSAVDSGLRALRWTFNDSGARWSNEIKLQFPYPMDLTRYSTLRLRFREDARNPSTDIGRRIYVDWYNNGLRPNGSGGVTTFQTLSPAGYRTIEINISDYKRDAVNSLFFYVDGGAFADGVHIWYLDNVSVY